MRTLGEIRRGFAAHTARTLSPAASRAAVAVVLRDRPGGADMLFIERAERAGDPWSGHMAFPGGRVGASDADAQRAAERETREEVGLDLTPAEILSRLDDVEGAAPGYERLVVSAFVYHVDQPPALTLNHEVRDALWVPVHGLLDAAHHVPYYWPREQRESHYPGIVVGHPERQVVWGLTYRFLELFFDALGLPLRR